jgi:tetratricopeptide (TPR) repeat protein
VTRRSWAAGALLAAFVLIAYAPALRAGYIWDDDRYVTTNPALRDVHGLAALWTTLDATPQFYPLTHTILWIEYALWGLDPRGYHIVGALFHAASAILLWRILRLLGIPGAWLAAAVFALHPVQVESVAWITEQKNTLSGLFYLAAARVFLGWTEGGRRDRPRPVLASALYAAALLSKTVTSTLPIGLGIVLWWKHGRIEKREIAWLAPLLGVGAILAAVTRHLEKTQIGATGAEWALTLPERTALSGRIVLFYFGKLAWPAKLVFIYPRWAPDAASLSGWLGTVTVVALLASTWALRERLGRGTFAALAFFVVTLIPALGFFDVYPMRYSWVADHFQYLASLGPIVLASAAATVAMNRLASNHPSARRVAPALAGIALAVLSGRTFARCHAYLDEETLWRDTVAQNDGAWIAHNNLGILLAEQGRNDEAARRFKRALELRPEHTGALANLGYLQELMGQNDEAAATLTRAAAARPGDADARTHLVHVLMRLHRPKEALPYALDAARLRPDDPDALADAGALLVDAGRAAEAIPVLERAADLRPGFVRAVAVLDLARQSAAGSGVRYPRALVPPLASKETPR